MCAATRLQIAAVLAGQGRIGSGICVNQFRTGCQAGFFSAPAWTWGNSKKATDQPGSGRAASRARILVSRSSSSSLSLSTQRPYLTSPTSYGICNHARFSGLVLGHAYGQEIRKYPVQPASSRFRARKQQRVEYLLGQKRDCFPQLACYGFAHKRRQMWNEGDGGT